MTDGADRDDQDEQSLMKSSAGDGATERSGDVLEEAARKHTSWARAVQDDRGLAKRLQSLAELSLPPITSDPNTYEALLKLAPDARRNLNDLLERLAPVDPLSLNADAKLRLEKAIEGLSRLSPSLDQALLKVDANTALRLHPVLPHLRDIQRSLNQLNQPAATTQTQKFITGTDALRYRGSKRVWHYTSSRALDQILRNGILWASSPHYLNDTSELLHGVEVVKLAIQRAVDNGMDHHARNLLQEVTQDSFVGEAMHEIFYVSASMADDSLTLWRNYAASDGFAIGLQPRKPLSSEGLLASDVEAPSNPNLPAVANWFRVHYTPSQKAALADSFVASAISDIGVAAPNDHDLVVQELRKHLLVLASTMKHESFADEREVRWITTNWAPLSRIHYEITDRGFVPVLHVRSSRADDERTYLPIAGLRCSPTTMPTIERTMSGLLSQRGYDAAAADVRRSVLPFRG